MSNSENFLQALAELLERFPEEAASFTVSDTTAKRENLMAGAAAKRCCRWAKVPGDGWVCLEWCD